MIWSIKVANKRIVPSHGFPRVEIFFVFVIEPDFDDPLVVVGDDGALLFLRQFAKVVGHEAPVNMPNTRAGHPLDTASTLPHLQQ